MLQLDRGHISSYLSPTPKPTRAQQGPPALLFQLPNLLSENKFVLKGYYYLSFIQVIHQVLLYLAENASKTLFVGAG